MEGADVLLHNAVTFVVALVVLLFAALAVLAGMLRLSIRVFGWFGSGEATAAQAAWRRAVRRGWLLTVALLMVVLGAGAGIATWQGIALDVAAWNRIATLTADDLIAAGTALAEALGIVLGALLVHAALRRLIILLNARLVQASWAGRREEALAEALLRLRFLAAAVVILGSLSLIAGALGLPEGVRTPLLLPVYIGVAVYASRFIVSAANLAIDALFEMSDRLAGLESPIRFLGGLKHLSGLTKRTVEYFVYVSTAIWAFSQLTPDTWLASAGRLIIRIIAIFYISRVLAEVCLLFMHELFLVRRPGQSDAEFQQRQTLVPVVVGLVRYGIYFAALVTILQESGVDPTPVLAGAGIVGIAVGLGAQAFVGDVVAGFFILFENLYLVGDLIEAGGEKGQVEAIGLRVTKLRDDLGVLHSIPNGDMRKVANHSREYVNAIADIAVSHEEDLRYVLDLIAAAGADLRDSRILSEVDIKVQEVRESGVVLRAMARVRPGMDEDIGDLLRQRIVEALRAAGVGPPRAQRVLLLRERRNGAPDSHVLQPAAERDPVARPHQDA